jgi:hypothetical protein
MNLRLISLLFVFASFSNLAFAGFSGRNIADLYLDLTHSNAQKSEIKKKILESLPVLNRKTPKKPKGPTKKETAEDFNERLRVYFENLLKGLALQVFDHEYTHLTLDYPKTLARGGPVVYLIEDQSTNKLLGILKVFTKVNEAIDFIISTSLSESMLELNQTDLSFAKTLGMFQHNGDFLFIQSAASGKDFYQVMNDCSESGSLCEEKLPYIEHQVSQIAETLAKVHQIGDQPGAFESTRDSYARLASLVDDRIFNNRGELESAFKRGEVSLEMLNHLRNELSRIKEKYSNISNQLAGSLPGVFLHGDANIKNFMVSERGIELIDYGNFRYMTVDKLGSKGTGVPGNDVGFMISDLELEVLKRNGSVEYAIKLGELFYLNYKKFAGILPTSLEEELLDASVKLCISAKFMLHSMLGDLQEESVRQKVYQVLALELAK